MSHAVTTHESFNPMPGTQRTNGDGDFLSPEESEAFLTRLAEQPPSRIRYVEPHDAIVRDTAFVQPYTIETMEGIRYDVQSWSPTDPEAVLSVPVTRLLGFSTIATINNYYGQMGEQATDLGLCTDVVNHPKNWKYVSLWQRARDAIAITKRISRENENFRDHTQHAIAGYSLGSMVGAHAATIEKAKFQAGRIGEVAHVKKLVMDRPTAYKKGHVPLELLRVFWRTARREVGDDAQMNAEDMERMAGIFDTSYSMARHLLGAWNYLNGSTGLAFEQMRSDINLTVYEGADDPFNHNFIFSKTVERKYTENGEAVRIFGPTSSHMGNTTGVEMTRQIDDLAEFAADLRRESTPPEQEAKIYHLKSVF